MRNQKTFYSNPHRAITFVLTIIFLIVCERGFSQNIFPSSGNVGIGLTNPTFSRLQITGDLQHQALGINRPQSTVPALFLGNDGTNTAVIASNNADLTFGRDLSNTYSEYLRIRNGSGNVGIGTINPSEKLDINGKLKLNNTLIIDGVDTGNPSAQDEQLRLSGYGILGNRGAMYISNENAQGSISFYVGGKHGSGSHLLIKSNGFVGIGTSNSGNFKLGVNGAIRAKEIKVDTGWSDFVFEKDYDLPSLEEVANHIAQKGHLKDIPSAAEVEKEGVFLGEMDAKLLQKIEELTLYLIEQNNALKQYKAEIKKLKDRIDELER